MSSRTAFTRSFLARYRRVYNTLIDVDDAYARLRRHRRQLRAIQAALRVIAEHRARSFLGVTLLHRHFRAEPNAVFVERRFTPSARRHKTFSSRARCPWRPRLPAGATPVRLHPQGHAPAARVHDRSGRDPRSRTHRRQRAAARGGCRDHRRERPQLPARPRDLRARPLRRPGHQRLPRGDAVRRAPVGRPRAAAAPARPGPPDPTLWTSAPGGSSSARRSARRTAAIPRQASATAVTSRIATSARPAAWGAARDQHGPTLGRHATAMDPLTRKALEVGRQEAQKALKRRIGRAPAAGRRGPEAARRGAVHAPDGGG